MIFGQIINVIMPLTLPWTFFMLNSGVRNFNTKMNSVLYFAIYFFGLLFPVYYFFELLLERKKKIVEERDGKVEKIRVKKNNNFQMTYQVDMWKMKDDDPSYKSNVGLVSQHHSIPNSIQEQEMSKKSKNAITPVSNHHTSKPRQMTKEAVEQKAKSLFYNLRKGKK